jgi:hypothetical protein
MSKETSIIDRVIAVFIFILASTSATLIPFIIMVTLNHQEWLAITISSILILLLCLAVRNRSRAAFYGSLCGYAFFLINALKLAIEN